MSETDNKNTPEDVYIKRFTKQQISEVQKLFEEGKSLEDISLFFQKKYKCKPIPISRLRYHLTRYYKKHMSENANGDAENNENHTLQPPVSIITNQDLQEIKQKMFSAPSQTNNPSNSLGENYKIVSKERDDLSGIPLKLLFFILIAILMVFVFLSRREKKKEKKKKSLKEPDPQNKSGNLNIKWV
ncbi:hypothetical protein LR013_03440 [candidate division NPL-UPA2 bacterium]|nr:hypothetical protein [candidate division NPL-UPA2 bacterium]